MNGCDKGNKKEHQGQCVGHSETKHTHISLLGSSFSLSFQSGFCHLSDLWISLEAAISFFIGSLHPSALLAKKEVAARELINSD